MWRTESREQFALMMHHVWREEEMGYSMRNMEMQLLTNATGFLFNVSRVNTAKVNRKKRPGLTLSDLTLDLISFSFIAPPPHPPALTTTTTPAPTPNPLLQFMFSHPNMKREAEVAKCNSQLRRITRVCLRAATVGGGYGVGMREWGEGPWEGREGLRQEACFDLLQALWGEDGGSERTKST